MSEGIRWTSQADLWRRKGLNKPADSDLALSNACLLAAQEALRQKEREKIPVRKQALHDLGVQQGKSFKLFGRIVVIAEILSDYCVRIEGNKRGRFPAQFLEPI